MKVTVKENFRVEITPKTNYYVEIPQERYEKLALTDCNSIIDQVKRHVDDIQYVEVKFDIKETCSYCLNNWDVSLDNEDPAWPKGTPLCCEKAIKEFENRNK